MKKRYNHLLYFDKDILELIEGISTYLKEDGTDISKKQVADMVSSQFRYTKDFMGLGDRANSDTYCKGILFEGIGRLRFNDMAFMRMYTGSQKTPIEIVPQFNIVKRYLKLNGWDLFEWNSIDGFVFGNVLTDEFYTLGVYKAKNEYQAHIILYEELIEKNRLIESEECNNVIGLA